jgi:glucosylceramidase
MAQAQWNPRRPSKFSPNSTIRLESVTPMNDSSRRRFLQQASAAAATLALARPLTVWAGSAASTPLRGWVTAGQDRYKPLELANWQEAAGKAGSTIQIDPAERYQSILGFGGAFTDATCFLFSRMEPAPRRQLMEELLGARGLGLSVGRTCIGSSDYSRNAYSYDDAPEADPELKHFSLDHDRAYILPMLREARQVNPELFLFSAPWSPPGWMKSSNTLLGGTMRKQYLEAYAQYFVKFLEGYRAEGVPISAVTTQNESDTNQDGNMPACLWGQEYEMGFVRDHLGPALRRARLDTKIWLLDHNYDLWGRVLDELSNPATAAFVDGVAWHGYVGTPDAMTRVHNAFPDKGAYWTEGGPDYTDPAYATDWAKWSSTYSGILRNWARTIVAWNLVLDEKGQPNIGPFNCGGLVTLDSKSGVISRSGMYWAFAHYAKTVRRGARVVASNGAIAGVDHVAFAHPEGDFVLVVTNQGQEREIRVSVGGKSLPLHLPAGSVVTVQWS